MRQVVVVLVCASSSLACTPAASVPSAPAELEDAATATERKDTGTTKRDAKNTPAEEERKDTATAAVDTSTSTAPDVSSAAGPDTSAPASDTATPAGGGPWDPNDHTTRTIEAKKVVKAGWNQIDIGAAANYENPAHANDPTKCPDPDAMTTKGTVDYKNGVWTLTGSGEGFWHGWDQGNLVYFEKKIRGDFTYSAQVTEFEMVEGGNLNGVAEAVLNVRDQLGYRQPAQSFVVGSAPNAFVFQGRFYWTGDKYNQWWYWPERNLPTKKPLLGWIRIQRRGDNLNAFYSSDGKDWGEPIKSNNTNHPFPLKIANAPEVHVGLACSARNDRNGAPKTKLPGKTVDCFDPSKGLLTTSARCVFQNLSLSQP